jgi:Holliday junction resolvasome RuvABC DNA-binding subunit
VYDDLLSALMNLGYAQRDAKRVIDQIVKEDGGNAASHSVEEMIKRALRMLSKVG